MVCNSGSAGTPKDVIARLNAEVLKAVGDPEVRRKLEELGFAVRGSSAEALRSMTRDQLAKYERVIRETGIAKEWPAGGWRHGRRRACPDRLAGVMAAAAADIVVGAHCTGTGAPRTLHSLVAWQVVCYEIPGCAQIECLPILLSPRSQPWLACKTPTGLDRRRKGLFVRDLSLV